MGELCRQNIVDLTLDLSLELVCCLLVDPCDENAVSGCSEALDRSYVLLPRGSTLWLVVQDKPVILPSLECFTVDPYRHCIDELPLQLLLARVCFLLARVCCFIVDLCDGSVASGNSKVFDCCYSFILLRATSWLVR